jgi:hypothetical protein
MLFLLHIAIPPLGSHPKTWDEYTRHIDTAHQTFTCLDSSTTIPLSAFNDGFVDCADASDEPSTGASANSTFFCVNERVKSQKIPGWSVGDGICDCCDGSDEASNSHSTCPNTCSVFVRRRQELIDILTEKFKRGNSERKKLHSAGKSMIAGSSSGSALRFVSWAIGALEIRQSQDDRPAPVWAGPFIWVWRVTFRPRKPRETLSSVVAPVLVKDLKRLQAFFAVNPDAVDVHAVKDLEPAAVALYGKEFESKGFKLSFLKEVQQRKISVGTFANFTGDVIYFHKGEHCDAINADRSFKLTMICNDENVLMSVQEPSTCVYEGVFATPIACKGTQDAGIAGYKLKRLEKMAEEFGVSL